MDIVSTILNASKVAGVSGTLLLGICSHESNSFTMNYSPHDHGSPSYGVCQVKLESARQLGFKGSPYELMDPKKNALWAARYLKYQESRYGNNLCKITAAYNSGSYVESKKKPGKPKNLKYVRLVQKRLPDVFKNRLNCNSEFWIEND
jgi:soluble lytic murein transglycosylase-like protein